MVCACSADRPAFFVPTRKLMSQHEHWKDEALKFADHHNMENLGGGS
jgi:hypothetical protein